MAAITQVATTPRQQERREAILAAARDVFLEHGFEGTNLDAVIARCGGSKRTIYAYFGNKAELFGAIVRETSESLFAALDADAPEDQDVETALTWIGRRYLSSVTDGIPLALFRTVISEGPRFPELARVFYEKGPDRAADRVDRLLEGSDLGRRLDPGERRAHAYHFFGLLREDGVFLPRLLGLRDVPTEREIDAVVERSVRIFLAGLVTQPRTA
jgi:AcrR family transcriptional regulator